MHCTAPSRPPAAHTRPGIRYHCGAALRAAQKCRRYTAGMQAHHLQTGQARAAANRHGSGGTADSMVAAPSCWAGAAVLGLSQAHAVPTSAPTWSSIREISGEMTTHTLRDTSGGTCAGPGAPAAPHARLTPLPAHHPPGSRRFCLLQWPSPPADPGLMAHQGMSGPAR